MAPHLVNTNERRMKMEEQNNKLYNKSKVKQNYFDTELNTCISDWIHSLLLIF